MAEANDLSKAKQIRNLLMIIGLAIMTSIAMLGFMLYTQTQAGTYLAKNVMLSPENVNTIFSPKTKSNSHFVFDLIEFSYYDLSKKMIKRVEINTENYSKLYKFLENDTSLLDNTGHLEASLNNGFAHLYFKTKDKISSQNQPKTLFQIDFIKDYYRISLRGQNDDNLWAYFEHKDVLEQVIKLLSNDSHEP